MYISNQDVSNRVIQIMNQLKVKQNQLAKLLNITQPAVSKYLQGRIPPPFVLMELSKLSGKTIEWILTGKDRVLEKEKIVAETQSSYSITESIKDKLEQLPPKLQKAIDTLVDSILENHNLK